MNRFDHREISRHKHVAWCKKRALEILDGGDLIGAYTSMVSDLKKHTETKDHIAIGLGMGLLMSKKLETSKSMRNFIEGFN